MLKPCLKILWVCYQDEHLSELIESLETTYNFQIDRANSNEQVLRKFSVAKNPPFDTAVIDARGAEKAGVELVQRLRREWPDFECILLAGRGGELRRQALKFGVYRIFEDPIRQDELLISLRLAAMHTRQRWIIQDILNEVELKQALKNVLDAAAALVQADETCIMILDRESNRLVRYPENFPIGARCSQIFKGGNLCREILRTGDVISVPDVQADERVDAQFISTNIRSFVAVPAIFNNRNVGVMYAFSHTPKAFEERGLAPLLDGPARLAGQAITSLRSHSQALARVKYTASLVNTSQALTQARTNEEQFELAWQYASQQLRVSTFYIGLYDPNEDTLHFPLIYDEGEPAALDDRRLGADQSRWGVSGMVVKTRKEVSWSTHQAGLQFCQKHNIQPTVVGQACESCFYLPLKKGDQPLGVMSIQSYAKYAFDETIKDAFRSLGSLLVVGLEKNRLVQEEKNRRTEAEILREASLKVASDLEMAHITQTTLKELRKIIPYDCATVQLLRGERFEIVDCNGFEDPAKIKGQSFSIRDHNPNRVVYESGRPLNLADAPAEYPQFTHPPHAKASIRSWLGVPMKVGGEWVGLLDLDKRQVGFFTRDHEKLAQALAANTALAIRNAQAMQTTRQTGEYIQSIFEASTKILSAPDSGQALKRIVDTVCKAAHAMRAHVLLMQNGMLPQLLVQSGFEKEINLATAVREKGKSWEVFTTKTPFYKPSINAQDTDVHPKMYAQGVRAVACLPLIINQKSIGVLWIHFAQPHEFTEVEKNILRLFAIQSAVAFDRISLLEKVTDARDQADRVAKLSTEDSYEATLKAVVTSVRKVMNCDSVTLYEYDQERQEFKFPPTLLGVNDPASVQALGKVSKRSIVWKVLELDQYHKTEDAQNDPVLLGDYDRQKDFDPFIKREGIVASLGFPLKIGSRKVGVMFVNYRHEHDFTPHDLINAGLFANQAAVVIQNSQLHNESSRRAALLKALSDAELVANKDLDLDEILRQITKKAWELTGRWGYKASLCNLSLVEGEWLTLHTVYPEEVKGLVQEIDLTGRNIGITGLAARTGQTQLFEDVHSLQHDHQYIVFDEATRAELAVPIFVDGKVRGVINVEAHEPGAFDEEDERSLEALAIQAGIAIKNAELIQHDREGDENIPTIAGAISAQIATLPPEQVLQMIVDTIRTYAGAWRAVALVIDAEADEYKVLAQSGFDPEADAAIPIRPNGVSMSVYREQTPVYRDNLQPGDAEVNAKTIQQGAKAVACLPLNVEGKTIGVLWIHFRDPHHFTDVEKKALELYTMQSALVFDHSQKLEEARRVRQELNSANTLLWMSMISNIWRHSIENNAYVISDTVDLLNMMAEKHSLDEDLLKTNLSVIQDQARQIMEKPITSPLAAEEGICDVEINALVEDRLGQLWANPKFQVAALVENLEREKPLYVKACPEWLCRSLDILVDNGVKATADRIDPQSERKLTVSISEYEPSQADTRKSLRSRRWVQIIISDNGPGIPEAVRPHILREPVPKQKNDRGLGLGLLMARSIVQVYGGDIRLFKTDSNGTDMAIVLPLLPQSSTPAAA